MPLSIVEGVSPSIVLYPVMAFINPYSKNQKAAQELMGFLAKHMSTETKIMLSPCSNTGLKHEDYDETIATYKAKISQLKELIKTAEKVDQAQMQEAIDESEAELREYIRYGGYEISPDAIRKYRKMISENGLSVGYLNENTDSFNQVVELSEQLMQRQISVEKYTSELDRILLQAELENQ